jgi:hypothetical protein
MLIEGEYDMGPIIIVTHIMPITGFVCGLYLIWRGISLNPDQAWQKHFDRQISNGLSPVRTSEWDRAMKFTKTRSIIAGCIFIVGSFAIVWIAWSNGLY